MFLKGHQKHKVNINIGNVVVDFERYVENLWIYWDQPSQSKHCSTMCFQRQQAGAMPKSCELKKGGIRDLSIWGRFRVVAIIFLNMVVLINTTINAIMIIKMLCHDHDHHRCYDHHHNQCHDPHVHFQSMIWS